jgi:TolA-binding protein
MNIRRLAALGLLGIGIAAALPATARAADKETRQMMADIRILQEQSQQLQNQIAALIATLNDSIKAVNGKIEDQTNASRKSLADQKLVIDAMAGDVRVLREAVAGDTGAASGAAPDAGAPPPPPAGAAGVGASPKKLLDGALADYFAGQYDLAAMGLESYVRTFPQSTDAPEAQLRAGNSYLQLGKNEKAVDAYDVVIRSYPKSTSVAEAYAKKGLALMNLKQYDRAKEALEYVIANFPPDNFAVSYAQQRLSDLKQITAPPAKR